MSYTANSQVKTPLQKREREMLLAGFSYAEIAETLGSSRKALSARNQLVYKISLQDAFARRVEREGIPCRLTVSDAFGYWFSGFFDGEGHVGVFSRQRPDRYIERRLSMQIILRDDDAHVIQLIKDQLGVGYTYAGKPHGATNAQAAFRVEQIQDLAEVMIPLFDRYPLHTKKSREFAIWRGLVRQQYILTMGGRSQRTATSQEQSAAFEAGLQAIKQIRTYRGIP